MTDIDQGAGLDLDEPGGRSPLVKWGLIGLIVIVMLGAGAGVWYFLLGGKAHFAPQEFKPVETPLPYFLEMKPLVVSIPAANGASHFVQLGISLQLPRAAGGEMITAVLPEVQDAVRQTLLGFKSDDLQNTEGVNKVRRALVKHLNEVLTRVLGPERLAKITEGQENHDFVQNILFATLIVE